MADPNPEPDKSPSPAPNPPTALTPGVRANAFMELYHKTLSKTLSVITYANFASCFPTIAASPAASSLKHIHEQFVSRMEHFAKDEFARICEIRRVVENLNGLEQLVKEAKRRKDRAVDGEPVPVP